ncbi:MAG TPA: carboxypeptidase-like regulatory domain-containing protein [Nitrospirales bacterium]|nr:carboxypeptidase-like regulatory domain-containing protein [Nitrospirales bacterium]
MRNWKYYYALLMSFSIGSLLTVSSALAYEGVSVTDGGTISGKVTLKGGKPVPRGFNLVTFPDPVYCGRISNGSGFRLLKEFTVAEDRGVKDVLVMLTGIQRGKPFDFPVTHIEARDCRFLPYITVVRSVGKVEVVNMDPVMHDIQAYETSELGPRVLFNVPLPMNPHHPKTAGSNAEYHKHIPGEPKTEDISMTKGRRIFVMQCGFHAYMESFGYAVDNPYYALTDQSGQFTIPDVPPGTYKLVAWHPQERPLVEQEVTVTAKGLVTVNFEIQAHEGARAGMEVVENPHFGLGILGEKEIKPTLELQQP